MMEYKGYIAKVEFDADARLLHGEVVGIRDVVTFQGESVSELNKAFRASVDDFLDFCKARGEEPDKPCSGQFLVRIDSELHRKANILASASGTSLNSFVAKALTKEVEQDWRRLAKTAPADNSSGMKSTRRKKRMTRK